MSKENETTITFSCDTFVEFDVEMAEPSETLLSSNAPSTCNDPLFAALHAYFDDLLKDSTFWQPPIRTMNEALCRLRDRLNEQIDHNPGLIERPATLGSFKKAGAADPPVAPQKQA